MTNTFMIPPARVKFAIRKPMPDNKWRYDIVLMRNPDSGPFFPLFEVPAVGDLVFLYDDQRKEGGVYKVVTRQWAYPGYGSMVWPYATPYPTLGPMVDVIVEPSDGAFHDEYEPAEPEEDDDEPRG